MSTDAPATDREGEDKAFPPHLAVAGGLLMGGADAIPGVSGGTIALIIGIYERFIASLEAAVKTPVLIASPAGRRRLSRAFGFLVPLGVGVLIAYYLATKLLVGATDDPGILRQNATAPACYAFFFGLVLASITQPWKRIRRRGPGIGVAAAAGFIAAFIFTGLPYQSATSTWMLLWGGAGAISVMLLPGVSGSLFLLIVGQYHLVVTAVHDRDAAVLAVFLGGLVLGAVLFVPVLRLLLDRRHDLTMAALTGLMAGSLRALWPWKTGYDPKLAPMSNVAPFGSTVSYVWVALGLVAGVAVVYLLALLERRMSRAA
jgi:putative membrane protein